MIYTETRAFYSTQAQGNPNTQRYPPGEQAFHAWAKAEIVANDERQVAQNRPEIGRVEQRNGSSGPWAVVFDRSKQAA